MAKAKVKTKAQEQEKAQTQAQAIGKARSISIFLLDGDPNGTRLAQISMSTIQAIAFRRTQLRRVRDAFPEIERPGVYILIGVDEDENDRQFAYIGESEGVGDRLSQHNANTKGQSAKEFWTDTVVLISKDENLTKSHARYIEACLIRSSRENPRWYLPNVQTPSEDAGKLPRPDRADMDEFVDQTKILSGALGWDLFREMIGQTAEAAATGDPDPSESAVIRSPRFQYKGREFSAEMELGLSGNFIVKAGSKARIKATQTTSHRTLALRNTLLDKGVLREEPDSLVFTSDYSFSSVSFAAGVVYGGSVSGRAVWKLPDGTTYADWEAHQGDLPPDD